MKERNPDFLKEIKDLLNCYEDGWDIFKKADDWDYTPVRKAEFKDENIPETWLGLADKVISIVAEGKYGLDTYPNVIEVVTANQMLDLYTKIGMPISYDHWSFGQSLIQQEKAYKGGQMGLAYELVINSSPSVAYCMEQNSKTMQMLVIAHASYGHNSFFKGNHLFKQFTQADEIIPDLVKMRKFIHECEEKYGYDEVELLLDACHTLESHGVDRYTKPPKRTKEEEAEQRREMARARREAVDVVMDTTLRRPFNQTTEQKKKRDPFQPQNEENLLRYMASDAPHLQEWQREIMRMMSNKAQYFYPQGQTKVMNEGWASFWHYTLMNDLYDLDLIDDGMIMEFTESHAGVLKQIDFDHKGYSGFNPYVLGFKIFSDIRRICETPTEEDREWFPFLAGQGDWVEVLHEAMENFKDESFILQYLSPEVMRNMRMFVLHDDEKDREYEITAIHNDKGFRQVRKALASQYRQGDMQPRIEAVQYDYMGDRALTLQHTLYNDRPINKEEMEEVLKHIYQLWKHPVIFKSVTPDGKVVEEIVCPPKKEDAPDDLPTLII